VNGATGSALDLFDVNRVIEDAASGIKGNKVSRIGANEGSIMLAPTFRTDKIS
jgi:hypothetical protein